MRVSDDDGRLLDAIRERGEPLKVCINVDGSLDHRKETVQRFFADYTRHLQLGAASVLRKNQTVTVLPFEQAVFPVGLNSCDGVIMNAGRLPSIGGGGTNCGAPVRLLNQRKAKTDLVLFVSDNESWVDQGRGPLDRAYRGGRGVKSVRNACGECRRDFILIQAA